MMLKISLQLVFFNFLLVKFSSNNKKSKAMDDFPPRMSREEKAVFISRISLEEKNEIRGLIINCLKEATVWRGTPCALASVIGLYALKERGIFKKWGMTSRMLVFGFVPAGVMVITDLLFLPTLPCAKRINQRVGELRNKYSEMDNQPDISFQGQRENFPRTTTAGKQGLTYAQLREANRSGQPLKMEQGQEDGSKFKPKMDEKFPSSFKPGATYMSGTPIGSPKPNIYGAPVSRPKPKDPGMMDIIEPDPPATSDFGFELFPMPSDTDNVDSKGSSKREEGKLRK